MTYACVHKGLKGAGLGAGNFSAAARHCLIRERHTSTRAYSDAGGAHGRLHSRFQLPFLACKELDPSLGQVLGFGVHAAGGGVASTGKGPMFSNERA